MIIHHFDLYPRDDPRDGARVVRFTQLQSAKYRGEANGTGSGEFTIRADKSDAANIDPRGLQYIRVVQEDTVAATEVVVGGFFLETGDFDALDTNTTRLLSFGGAGVLSYLSRATMAPHTYIHDVFTGQDPFDDTWRLYAQSTVYANGNFLGAMLWRVIYEAQHYRNTATYTHRHADGIEYTDSHADDRLAADVGIPDLVMDFDQFDDSNGNAWDQTSGEFKAQVLENVQAVAQRLMQAGLYLDMDPDTFELRAFQADDHRRDRTGTTWGANVIYLTRPTGDDIDTGNIKDKLSRAIRAFIKRRTLWVGGGDVYSKVTGTTDIPWEGGVYSDTNDTTALTQIGNVQIGARDDAGDTLQFPIRVGNGASTGYYRPFVDILLDDLVTVNSGTGQFDINDQNFPVAAITVFMKTGGDWGCIVDLGSSYSAAQSRQFQVSPVAAHNHPPNPQLCPPGKACEDLGAGDLTAGTATNGDGESGVSTQWSGGTVQTTQRHGGTNSIGFASTADGTVVYTWDPAQIFSAGVRYVVDIWSRRNGTHVSTDLAFGVDGGDQEVVTGLVEADFLDTETGADGDSWGLFRICWTPNEDRTGVRLSFRDQQSSAAYFGVDDLALYTADADNETTGTSNRAARCDHNHRHNNLLGRNSPDAHTASAVGFVPAGTISATDVQAAIEEVAAEAGVTDHGALTGLTDDDHTQYVLRSILTAKGSLFVRNGSGAVVEVPVGSDDQVLTADSAQALGVKWAEPATSGAIWMPLASIDPVSGESRPVVDANGAWIPTNVGTAGGSGGNGSDHGSLSGLGDFDHDQYVRGESTRSLRMIAGVLRKTGGTWSLLDDASHTPVNLNSVSSDTTKVTITYDFAATATGAILVGTDETWGLLYHAGASVGLSSVEIYITDMDGNAVNPSTVADSAFGNFWIIGIMEV